MFMREARERIQHDVDRSPVSRVRHIFDRNMVEITPLLP